MSMTVGTVTRPIGPGTARFGDGDPFPILGGSVTYSPEVPRTVVIWGPVAWAAFMRFIATHWLGIQPGWEYVMFESGES